MEWITRRRNARYFTAIVTALIVIVIIFLILTGIFLFSNDNSASKSQEITKKEIADQEKLINQYYEAIGQGNYKVAYNLTSANYQRGRSYENFVYQYKTYIKSVKIKSITRLKQYSNKTTGVFNVTFNAIYKQKYSDGNGELPQMHVVQRDKENGNKWKLDSIGIGQ